MTPEELIEEELKQMAGDPRLVFLLGKPGDWCICVFNEDGEVCPVFMSDEKGDRLEKYLHEQNRAFRTIQEARDAFQRIEGNA